MPIIVNGADYLNLPRESETWLVKPLLPQGGAMILYGDPKVGKSYAAIQLAEAIQLGKPWLGFTTNPGKVVYIQLDTPRSLWATRLEALRDSGVAVSSLALADRETIGLYPFNILNDEHFSTLREALSGLQPDCVILDTIRESHNGDENDSTVMKNVISALVAATQPAALVLIAHSKKPNSEHGPSLINDTRGSSYVVGRMDAIVRFSKRGMYYTGRAIEEGSVKITRLENGLWTAQDDDLDVILAEVLADDRFDSMKSRAVEIAARTGKSEEAARSILRRIGSQ